MRLPQVRLNQTIPLRDDGYDDSDDDADKPSFLLLETCPPRCVSPLVSRYQPHWFVMRGPPGISVVSILNSYLGVYHLGPSSALPLPPFPTWPLAYFCISVSTYLREVSLKPHPPYSHTKNHIKETTEYSSRIAQSKFRVSLFQHLLLTIT